MTLNQVLELQAFDIQERICEDLFFKAYPSSNNGFLTLELQNPTLENNIMVEIISLLGKRLIYKRLPPQSMHTLSHEGQQPGIFIIRVDQGDTIDMDRIIKR